MDEEIKEPQKQQERNLQVQEKKKLHDLKPLTDALKSLDIPLHIETSGSHPLSGEFDWITFSPKKFKATLNETFEVINLPRYCHLQVWNRWGNLVFQSADYQNDWRAEGVPEGVYVFRLLTADGREYTGSVTVMR